MKTILRFASVIIFFVFALVLFSSFIYYFSTNRASEVQYLENQTVSTIATTTSFSTTTRSASTNTTITNETSQDLSIGQSRSSLLQYYSSEASNHETLLLTLSIGLFGLIQVKKRMDSLSNFLFPTFLSFILTGIIYIGCRLLLWGQLSSWVIEITPFSGNRPIIAELQLKAVYDVATSAYSPLIFLSSGLNYPTGEFTGAILCLFFAITFFIIIYRRPNTTAL